MLHGLNVTVSLSVKTVSIVLIAMALLRAVLKYAEQRNNHYIAFTLLAIMRSKVFKALRRLCPAKLEGRDKGNLISLITSDVELLEVFYVYFVFFVKTLSTDAVKSKQQTNERRLYK